VGEQDNERQYNNKDYSKYKRSPNGKLKVGLACVSKEKRIKIARMGGMAPKRRVGLACLPKEDRIRIARM
jgi:hypothetical protein